MTNSNSTWRLKETVLKPSIVNDIIFSDTKPNYVLINNLGAADLYLSVTGIPSDTIYDKKIPGYGEALYAQDLPMSRVQIYVAGTQDNMVKITSFVKEFNPAAIATPSTPVSTGGGGGGATYDGIIKGFTVPLPSGANNIGKVVVTDMPSQTIVLDTLPAGTNNIGKVTIDSLPPLANQPATSKIGDVGIVGGITINSMPPIQVSSTPIAQAHQVFESAVSLTEVVFDMTSNPINFVSYVENEGTTDVFVNFDDNIASGSGTSGLNQSIRLKAGQILGDLNRRANKIRFIRTSGNGNVRFMGV